MSIFNNFDVIVNFMQFGRIGASMNYFWLKRFAQSKSFLKCSTTTNKVRLRGKIIKL